MWSLWRMSGQHSRPVSVFNSVNTAINGEAHRHQTRRADVTGRFVSTQTIVGGRDCWRATWVFFLKERTEGKRQLSVDYSSTLNPKFDGVRDRKLPNRSTPTLDRRRYGCIGRLAQTEIDTAEVKAVVLHDFGPVTLGGAVYYSGNYFGSHRDDVCGESRASYRTTPKLTVSGAAGRQSEVLPTLRLGTSAPPTPSSSAGRSTCDMPTPTNTISARHTAAISEPGLRRRFNRLIFQAPP